MIETVIFDLDGTLVDSVPGIEYAAAQAWKAVQPGLPVPSFRPLIGPPIRQVFCQLLPAANLATIDALHRTFRSVYDNEGWIKTMPYPGVVETLTALKTRGVQCLGATYKPSLPTQHILKQCGLQTFFRAFLSPDSVNPPFGSKADILRALIVRYSLEPAHTLLVGDTASDAVAALACGLRFIAFAGGFELTQPSQFQAEMTCFEFADLLKLIQNEAV